MFDTPIPMLIMFLRKAKRSNPAKPRLGASLVSMRRLHVAKDKRSPVNNDCVCTSLCKGHTRLSFLKVNINALILFVKCHILLVRYLSLKKISHGILTIQITFLQDVMNISYRRIFSIKIANSFSWSIF